MKKLLLSLIAALTIASCSDNLLDQQPVDRIVDETVWSDPGLVQAFVTSKYRDLGFGFNWNGDEVLWSSFSDESLFRHDYGVWVANRGELTPNNLGILADEVSNPNLNPWGKNYRYIRDANLFFERIGTVPMDSAQRRSLTGEMKFLRAFRYFDLIRNYGAVPLITQTFALGDDFAANVARAPLADCINFVVREADEAAALLPTAQPTTEVGRATKGAAMALKARMLLYAASPLYTGGANDPAKWQAAAQAAKAIMDLNLYTLFPDYQQLFLSARNPEIIFDRGAANVRLADSGLNLERNNGPNGFGGWGGNMPIQNLVDAYETTAGKPISDPTSGYDPQRPYANRDPRLAATVLYNGSTYRGRTIETFTPDGLDSPDGPDGPEPWNTSTTGYYLRKFMNENRDFRDAAGSQAPWIYFRLGEVLLNYAEAQNEATGPDASVYEAINRIRARARMPNVPAGLSQAQLREAIRRERQVELAFEEHRFYDVRRWQIAEQTENEPARGVAVTRNAAGVVSYTPIVVQQRRFQVRNYRLPIPVKEIQANPNLQQNEGW
jgi:starch-binding outer membrane protein, SusD/RagB family